MIRKKVIQALVFLSVLAVASLSQAITMDLTADGTDVTIKMSAKGALPATGRFIVNFGDGSAPVTSPLITLPGNSINVYWSTTHSYAKGGTYSIIGTWVTQAGPDPFAPLTATKVLTLLEILPEELPKGNVAEEYREVLTITGGTPPYRFRLASGRLPNGMEFTSNGILKGTPDRLGKYRFEVEAKDAKRLTGIKQYEFIVGSGEATIRVLPSKQQVSRQGVLSNVITYEYVGTAVQDRLYSSRGEFKVGGSIAGHVNKGLTLNVRNGKARSSESISIPASIIRRAEQINSTKIVYNRYFESKSILGRATCTFTLTAGGGTFRLTQMRLYFDNNRPRIVVPRSSRDLSASVDINYTGTGLFKGFWEVDGRIIKRVQKNIHFGKSFTLTTPNVPPLPTYAEGSHKIRFVVTSPEQQIPFPVAFYDVVEKGESSRGVISLLTPGNRETILFGNLQFSWQERTKSATYLISFFDTQATEKKDEEPLFSAYTKKNSYTLPAQVKDKLFKVGGRYEWMVLEVNDEGKIISESTLHSFFVENGNSTETPLQ